MQKSFVPISLASASLPGLSKKGPFSYSRVKMQALNLAVTLCSLGPAFDSQFYTVPAVKLHPLRPCPDESTSLISAEASLGGRDEHDIVLDRKISEGRTK
jgi:hypothetical protein